ncbi:MAG: hypothetical protein JXB00_16725 [Bacteroidales bacterium]|nr:hypothetical protein [Bacteroidales bacterium]
MEKIYEKCNGQYKSEFIASRKSKSLNKLDSLEINYLHEKRMFIDCNDLSYFSLIKGRPNCFVIRCENTDYSWYKLLQIDNGDIRELYTLSKYNKKTKRSQNNNISIGGDLSSDFMTTYFNNKVDYLLKESLDRSNPWSELIRFDSISCKPKEILTLNRNYRLDSFYYHVNSIISGNYIRTNYLKSKHLNSYWNDQKVESDSIYYVSNSGLIKISKKEYTHEFDTSAYCFYLLNDTVGIYRYIHGNDTSIIYTDRNGNIPYNINDIQVLGTGCGGGFYADLDDRINIIDSKMKLNVLDKAKHIFARNNINFFVIRNNDSSEKEFVLLVNKNGYVFSLLEIYHKISSIYGYSLRYYKTILKDNNIKFLIIDEFNRRDPLLEGSTETVVTFNENGTIVREKKIIKKI